MLFLSFFLGDFLVFLLQSRRFLCGDDDDDDDDDDDFDRKEKKVLTFRVSQTLIIYIKKEKSCKTRMCGTFSSAKKIVVTPLS